MEEYQCRICGSSHTECLGGLQNQTQFAGKPLEKKLPETNLYRCNTCLMLTRHPILSVPEYNDLYAKGSSSVWSNKEIRLRPDQTIARNIILNIKSAGKVLDVGCYTGDFLSSLPSNYIKYGVEMSKEASTVSVGRGIKIIGNDLYHIKTNDKFDLIVAIDVIEHTQNPEEFLKKLSTMLEKNGEIIISTGNTDNWLWKHLKNRFWYSKYPEHISFIGERWLEQFCEKNSFLITVKHKFRYSPINFQLRIKSVIELVFSLLRIYPENFSNTTNDHFCFAIKVKRGFTMIGH